jgi:hypothetical protein
MIPRLVPCPGAGPIPSPAATTPASSPSAAVGTTARATPRAGALPDLIAGAIACLLLGLGFGPTPRSSAATPATMDFNRDVRPLFARHCTACHGGVKAAGGLSFVYRDKAITRGKSGEPAILPGQPDASELLRRVTATDPSDRMPPPDHGPALSTEEINTLRLWIQQGAPWSEHWSFVPPREPAIPTVQNPAWPRIPADHFILATLESHNLQPSPEATPAEWLRRVSLDLIGLPPTPREYQAFLRDLRDNPGAAREQVVNRLLASPHFGERWAAVWLDLARYSDTFGFEKDPHRDIWPWRDWVIRAFNADLPFDEFTIRQLAGDLLENPTADDLLATAFHRNTQNNTEGGTDDEEYRTAAVHDRVNTTWTAWQATTFGCAQCHDHPYDPLPHRDYYRFAAFFDNTEDCDQNDDFPRLLFASEPSRRDEVARAQFQALQLRRTLNDSAWSAAGAVKDWKPLVPTRAQASGGSLEADANGRVHASGTLPVNVVYSLTLPAVPGMTALAIDLFPESTDPKRPPERGQIFSKLKLAVIRPDTGATNPPLDLAEMIADHLDGPFDPARVLDAGGGFGSYPVMQAPRRGVVVLKQPLDAPAGATLLLTLEHGIASNSGVQGCALRHFALEASTNTALTTLVNDPERRNQWKQLAELRGQSRDVPGTRVPVLLERAPAATRDTRVFIRGNRLTRDEPVRPGIPDITRPPQTDRPLTRLDMARWLVGDQNPLAARVLANRLWAELFGRGIVETLEDFGTSGATPSHPELLDHLALRLRVQARWSIKRFLREIVLSATYAQSSRVPPALAERDPDNRLLARGPRTRLTAEMIRDQALLLTGALAPKAFGPPVYPPQPEGVWNTVYSGDRWNTSQDADRFRRAIYTYQKRTSGYPVFLTFDAPTRDACTARRIPSNTPLQALTTLNDPAFLEMAQSLANRMEAVADSPRARIRQACRLLTLAPPPRETVDSLLRLYHAVLDDLRGDPASADKLGPSPERAALVLVANTLLNLDIALTR